MNEAAAAPRVSALRFAAGCCLVAPRSYVRVFDLQYQVYLYKIFHRRKLCILCHLATTPLIAIFFFAWLGLFRWDIFKSWDICLTHVVGMMMLLYYLVIGIKNRVYSLSLYLFVQLLGVWMFSLVYLAITRGLLSHKTIPWYRMLYGDTGGPWYTNPLLWMMGAATLQALSHITEPAVPPFVNCQTKRWTVYSDTWEENRLHWLAMRVYTLLTLPLRALLEVVSTPRMLANQGMLSLMGMGFYRWFRDDMDEAVDNAIELGDAIPMYYHRRKIKCISEPMNAMQPYSLV